MFDTLIENGTVVDGTGAPWFRCAVGMRGGTITLLHGETTACDAVRRIDATGRVVCPGFVDVHAHSDLSHLLKPTNDTKVRQGVATEINGNCGIGYVPLSQSARRSMARYFCGVTGRLPESAAWAGVEEYLSCVDRHSATNQGMLVPHGCLRLEVVGWEQRPATRPEIRRMADILRRALEEGALGLSTGLTYPPGMWGHTEELVELCGVVREMGGIYATHVRYTLGDGILDGFREAISIAKTTGCRLHISHFYAPAALRGTPERMLALIDDARTSGVDVTFDAYTYVYGSSTLASVLPGWAFEAGPEFLFQHLPDSALRNRIRASGPPRCRPDDILIASVATGEDKHCEGRVLTAIAESRGQDAWDAIFDLLQHNGLEVSFTVEAGDSDDIAAFVRHEAYMVGTDALFVEGHGNPRSYGTFPRLLETYVRNRRSLSLEDAVAKMTWIPARRFGLAGRGQLVDDAKADIVVFDPLEIGTSSTLANPDVRPVGIDHVFVNGIPVLDHGVIPGSLPGRALRREGGVPCT